MFYNSRISEYKKNGSPLSKTKLKNYLKNPYSEYPLKLYKDFKKIFDPLKDEKDINPLDLLTFKRLKKIAGYIGFNHEEFLLKTNFPLSESAKELRTRWEQELGIESKKETMIQVPLKITEPKEIIKVSPQIQIPLETVTVSSEENVTMVSTEPSTKEPKKLQEPFPFANITKALEYSLEAKKEGAEKSGLPKQRQLRT